MLLRAAPERSCESLVPPRKAGSHDAFYGPDASRATKVVVSIIPSENAEPSEMRDWQIVHGDVRNTPEIAAEMSAFIEVHGVISAVMTDSLLGCPHQEGIDYEGEYCPDPACAFWYGRD